MNLLKTRRRFLKSVLGASAMAPLSMTGMANLAVAAGGSKLKVVFMVIPDGFGVDPNFSYNSGIWFPTGTGDAAQAPANGVGGAEIDASNMNEMAKGLSQYAGSVANNEVGLGPYVKDSLFLKNFIVSNGAGGHNGWKFIMRDNNGSQTSIDNILAEALPGSNPTLKRINSGPHATVGAQWNVSWHDQTMQIPYNSPYSLYDLVYNGVEESNGSGNSAPGPSRSRFLGPVEAQLTTLKNQLGPNLGTKEQAKLNDHLDAVYQLGTDLDSSLTGSTGACSPSAAEPTPDLSLNAPAARNDITSAHIDIVANALSCGLTRVGNLQLGRSADQVAMPEVSNTVPHDCAHAYGSEAEWLGSRQWYVTQCKKLLDQLSTLPDPDVAGDSLLDHTLVVFTSEMADGDPEHMQDVGVTLFGAKEYLNTGSSSTKGRFLDLYNQAEQTHWKMGKATGMQRLWSTVAQAAGTSVPYSGDITPLKGIFNNV